jgi:lipopolysaccharide/colanic/teichoic acid biosynthesis glycosyltransferase
VMYSAVESRGTSQRTISGTIGRHASPKKGRAVKRWIDLSCATIALFVLSPLLLLSALFIYMEDRGPILFTQERVGRDGRSFRVFKFRSMQVNDTPVEEMGQVREDHPMVTRTGKVLRRLKIDELPQLLNVLVGDMSLVGPRPTIREQVERYDAYERRRLLAVPGVTGWAQVNGNTRLEWSERILLDVWYVGNWSLWLDMKILVQTIQVILQGEQRNEAALLEAVRYADGTCRSG